jgi:DNA polymerase-3 subunit epsilon
MYNRALSHFNSHERKGKKMLNDLYNVDFVLTGSECIAILLESEEIKKHKPRYNRSRVSDNYTHSIGWFEDEKGIINFSIMPYEEAENILLSFTSNIAARERLEQWIDEYTLCINHCGLTSKDSVCFNHHIKKCNGICAGEEEVALYNQRADKILKQFISEDKNYAIIEKGRSSDEHSLIVVENRKYLGYGYFDASCVINEPGDFKNCISRANYYPDADILLRGWLKRAGKVRKVRW